MLAQLVKKKWPVKKQQWNSSTIALEEKTVVENLCHVRFRSCSS